MGRSKAAGWIAGTVVLALVLAAGAWFLLISDLLDETAEMESQAESEWSRVDQLEITLAALARDFENIETFRAELEGLQTQIPGSIEISEIVRRLSTMAGESGVIVTGAATTTAVDITPQQEAPAPPATDGEGGETSGDAVADSAAPAPTTPAQDVLYAVPVELVTVGGYDQTLAFVTNVMQNERLMVVGTMQLTALEAAAAEGGLPALTPGFVESRTTVWVFVLLSPDGTAEVVEPPEGEELPEEVLPVPSGQKNPFLPQTA